MAGGVLLLLALPLALLATASPAAAAASPGLPRPLLTPRGGADAALVRTSGGLVRGRTHASGVTAFFGVPYAAQPVGARRFRPPAPVEAWAGVLDAERRDITATACPQLDVASQNLFGREDCLTVDVWVPPGTAAGGARGRPVMVYIHGGAFWLGDQLDYGLHDAGVLARDTGHVVVLVQYRLGVFGFFAAGALRAEDPEGSTGNYGLQDQREALRWVRDNAAAFGGDPDNVTIFGVSAGGMSVCAQVASPAAAGLFHRAIVQSGNCDSDYVFVPLDAALDKGDRYVATLGCRDDGDAAQVRRCLRAKTTGELMDHAMYPKAAGEAGEAAGAIPSPNPPLAPVLPWTPTVDGSYLTGTPLEMIRTGAFNKVPFIMGNVKDEGSLFALALPFVDKHLDDVLSAEKMLRRVLGRLWRPEVVAEVLREFDARNFSSSFARVDALITSYMFVCSSRRTVREMRRQGVPAWRYVFAENRGTLAYKLLGDFHTTDMDFLFGPTVGGMTAREEALKNVVQRYWSNFAATGDPNGNGGGGGSGADLRWPEGDRDAMLVLKFAPQEVEYNRYTDVCDFWDRVGEASDALPRGAAGGGGPNGESVGE